MKFSVIIPLYNKAHYVEKAIHSVFNQTCLDYELIVVNDGSTDGSLDVVKNVIDSANHNKVEVKIINQENSGVATARNNGVNAAQGELVTFLDADDWWADIFLEEMLSLCNEFPQAGIYGCAYYRVIKGKNYKENIGVDKEFKSGLINYFKVYSNTMKMPLTSISVVIPKSVYLHNNGFKHALKLGEDFDLWIRIAFDYPVAFLNKQLAFYNQDVDLQLRAVGNLHHISTHMLFNLDYTREKEESNIDYKKLLDNLRAYGLTNHYLNDQYREAALKELGKIDWSHQPRFLWKRYYKNPVWIEKLKSRFRILAKQLLYIIK